MPVIKKDFIINANKKNKIELKNLKISCKFRAELLSGFNSLYAANYSSICYKCIWQISITLILKVLFLIVSVSNVWMIISEPIINQHDKSVCKNRKT